MESVDTQTDISYSRKRKCWLNFRKKLRFAIFRRDNFTCRYCGRTIEDGAKLELEHIVPISKGGDYSPLNLLTACQFCNQGKAADMLTIEEIQKFKRPDISLDAWLPTDCKWDYFNLWKEVVLL